MIPTVGGDGGVLVVAAHPDDAELGVGGTIAALADAGVPVTVVVVAASERADLLARRRAAAEDAARVLGHALEWLADDLRQVEELPEHRLVAAVDELVDRHRPGTVVSHWEGDGHVDHALVARAVAASARRWTATLLAFRPTEQRGTAVLGFAPNVLVDTTATHDRKREALRCHRYDGQGYRPLDDEAVVATDRYWGTVAGTVAAEPLVLVRQIARVGALHPVTPRA